MRRQIVVCDRAGCQNWSICDVEENQHWTNKGWDCVEAVAGRSIDSTPGESVELCPACVEAMRRWLTGIGDLQPSPASSPSED